MSKEYLYKKLRKHYEEMVKYTNSVHDISKEIKDEILSIMEKYRVTVGWMEDNEFKELLQECIKEKSSRPMQKGLHRWEFGAQDNNREDGLYNSDKGDKTSDGEDEYYNCRD